jgi:hypothetical protein
MPSPDARRSRHSVVVAYLALFVAVGGTAFAAATVTGKDVVDGSLTGADVKTGSIRSPDVKGVTGDDLGPGAAWTLRSPDKRFSLAVENDGATITGPGGTVTVSGGGVEIDSAANVTIRSSGSVRIGGAVTQLGNGSNCTPLALGPHAHAETGSVTGPPLSGGTTTTVLACD